MLVIKLTCTVTYT